MTLSSIASKLRALRALADDPGATEAERLAATAKYAELLDKYHLDASELEIREEGTEYSAIEFGTLGNGFLIAHEMGRAIGQFTHCKVWVTHRTGTIKLIGLKSDAQFAEWLIRSLVAFVQEQALAYTLDGPPPTERRRNGVHEVFANDVATFVSVEAARISRRLELLANGSQQSTALVVVRSKMIDDQFESMGINLAASRKIAVTTGSDAAKFAGYEAGDRANFARPTAYTPTLRIGK